MPEDTMQLEGLRPEVQGPVRTFAGRLQQDLGENLRSLTLVGSALTADFNPTRSDINTVLVVGRRSHELLELVASYGKKMGRLRLRAPLLMTDEYIERSRDVFGVELLDFQLNHRTVIGPDPFADLAFQKRHVRLQVERELKAALMELRQGYIRAAGKRRLVSEMVMACVGQLLPLLRAMLWLKDAERTPETSATVRSAAEAFDFDTSALDSALGWRREGKEPPPDRVDALYEGIYQSTDQLSREVDQLEVTS